MKSLVQLCLFLVLSVAPAIGQTKKNSNNTLSNTNPVYTEKYRRIENYIPGANTPVKTVQLSFNIFTGPGTLQDNDSTRARFRQLIDWVNAFYSHNARPTDSIPGVVTLPDTKIRFDIGDRIFFYDSTKLYNSCSTNDMEKVVKANDPSRMQYLNVYFTFGPCVQHASAPYPGLGDYPTINSLDADQYVMIPITVNMGFASAQTLAHELGHALDLMHTYEASCCHETCDEMSPEFLDDIFGKNKGQKCWQDADWACDPNSPNNTCTNNIMGGVAALGYYFSPKQIGKMHRALSIKTVKRYVREDVVSPAPLYVTGNETWDFDMRVYSDIVIKKGATLTIKGKIDMPAGCKIRVSKRARLTLDGGTIAYVNSDKEVKIRYKDKGK